MIKPFPAAKRPPPPDHLRPPEADLWNRLVATYSLSDVAAMSLLQTAMDSHARARQAREQIDAQGMTTTDRWGQIKPHPLLAAERDARAAYLVAMRALNLDVGS